jgi:predicted amidohydrolase
MSQVARNRLIGGFFALLALLLSSPASAGGRREGLIVSGVQTRIDFSLYDSEKSFSAAVRGLAGKAVSPYGVDIIVFPEYLDVFLSFMPYQGLLSEADSIAEGLAAVASSHSGLRSIGDIVAREDRRVEAYMDALWGSIARELDAVVVAGTYLDYHPDSGKITNTAVVYGRDGKRLYVQDKVFLTEFEKDILGLEPGLVAEAEPFPVGDSEVAVTICRDTFFDDFYPAFRDADLWIDIKANGEAYGPEQKILFARALPSRLAEVPVAFGLTVCLTGRYLDLFWEGESSFIGKIGPAVGVLHKSRTATSSEVLTVELPIEP